MIVVDRALEQRAASGRPVQVGMVGAGAMGRGIARQMFRAFPGLRLAAIANRTLDNARRAYAEVGVLEPRNVGTAAELEGALAAGDFAVTDDPFAISEAPSIEAMVEVTGTVEHAAHVVESAIANGKDIILMNAELDGTVGPILKAHADQAGVILSACDGDQPGVEANLYRFVKGIGLRPLVCGNIKGLQDPYRTPTTQQGYADTWGLGVLMVTSFADGTKVSYEQAIVANATGMRAPKRGLNAWQHSGHVDELTERYQIDDLERQGGIVDYVVGAQPAPGIYVIATHDDPLERHYLKLYKKGDGPLYSFYTPQHLCHFEVPTSVARVALLRDVVLAPLAGPVVEVIATAKRDLAADETLDGIGGYMTYGQCENAGPTREERLLPMGVAEGCRLVRPVPRDQVLTYADV
ncbi:MAG TPA: NAD(P)-dependent oxidoreductase, partial [Candidatus Limnocylindria bacterium]|nr:NAD(P)-dependent oxidoreductase [Candidatus Limnocylindria bacterium]